MLRLRAVIELDGLCYGLAHPDRCIEQTMLK